MKAAKKFKRLVDPSKAGQSMQSILGDEYEAHFVEPPMEMDDSEDFPAVGLDANAPDGPSLGGGIRKVLGRHPMFGAGREVSGAEGSVYSEGSFSSRPEHSPSSSRWPSGVFEPERKDSSSIRSGRSTGKADFTQAHSQSASPHPTLSRASSATTKRSVEGTRGHARDPLEEEFPYLFIGPSTYTGSSQESSDDIESDATPIFAEPESTDEVEPQQIVSESPGAAEFDIYETAYRQELERIESDTYPGAGAKVYLTRRVQNTHDVLNFVKDRALDLQVEQRKFFDAFPRKAPSGFSAAVSLLRSQMDQKGSEEGEQEQSPESEQSRPAERRGSHPPSSSLSSQSLPGPEASLNEATGMPDSESNAGRVFASKAVGSGS